MIYTFYSYKGGVGRSMALVNIAQLMYRAGLKVLMVDWDLEAPGLERFFPDKVEWVQQNPGVIDMLLAYKDKALQFDPASGETLFPIHEIKRYVVDIDVDTTTGATLSLLPAGRRLKKQFAEYVNRVKTFEWQDFYQNWEGEIYFEWLRQQLVNFADVVLVDSRTGIAEMGSVCTYQLADVVVLLCAANEQNIDGTLRMLKSFSNPRLPELRNGRELKTLVVPSRIEPLAQLERLNKFRQKFAENFAPFIPSEFQQERDFLIKLEIPYVPLYAFEEIIAVNQTNTDERAVQMEEAYYMLLQILSKLTPKDSIIRKKCLESSNLADFIIVTALEEERDAVLDKLPGYQRLMPSPHADDTHIYYLSDLSVIFPDGSHGSYRIVVISLLGMGRVQATISTADAIRRWRPRYVILVGIAGGVETVRLGDILISDEIIDYELQKLTTSGPQIRWQVHTSSPQLREAVRNFHDDGWRKLIKISRPDSGKSKTHIGPVASGDKVIASSEVLKTFRAAWPKLIGIEMEGGGVAVASFQVTIPPEFIMVRGVSDLVDEGKGSPHIEKWRTYACDVAASYAIGLLQNGPVSPSEAEFALMEDEQAFANLGKREELNLKARVVGKSVDVGGGSNVELPYGMIHPNSEFYIERKADQESWQEISRSRSVTLYIQAPRQMGKSSLIYRILDRAKKTNHREFVFIDFQMLPEQYLKDEKIFFREFCRLISASLGISDAIDQYWQDSSSHIMKCSDYVSKHIISQLSKPFILALDELERTLISPFRNDFFGMLRSWHTRRAFDENFAKISLFLSSSTDPYLLIENPHQSPFNVARRIVLDDFTLEQVTELNRRHNSPLEPDQISHIMNLLEGHPYLTRLAFYLLATRTVDLDTLLNQATEDNGPFGEHLRYYYLRVLQKPELRQALIEIYHNQIYEKNELLYRLQEAGLIRQLGQKIVLRNELYRRYFKERLNV